MTAEESNLVASKHFDVAILENYVNGERAAVVHLIGLLRKQLSSCVESLRGHLQSEDLHEIKQMGHKLRGTARISGLPGIFEIGSALEELDYFDPIAIKSLSTSLEDEINVVLMLTE